MARKKAMFIFCDNPDCKVSFEISEDTIVIPDGWLQAIPSHDGRYHSQNGFEFCSPKCLSTWARYRDKAMKGEPLTKRSGPAGGNPLFSENVEVNNEKIQEIFQTGDEYSIQEVAVLSELNRSTVQKRVDEMVMKGDLFQTVERRGPHGARYRINA